MPYEFLCVSLLKCGLTCSLESFKSKYVKKIMGNRTFYLSRRSFTGQGFTTVGSKREVSLAGALPLAIHLPIQYYLSLPKVSYVNMNIRTYTSIYHQKYLQN